MSDIIKAPMIIAVLQDLARDVKSWERGGMGKKVRSCNQAFLNEVLLIALLTME